MLHAQAAPRRAASTRPPVVRRCACGGKDAGGGECEECRRKRLQRNGAGRGPALAPPLVHAVLRSPGKPLDAPTRAAMEPRFGESFAGVRIHAEERAAASAAAVGAHAWTVGQDIAFAAGKYQPATADGRRLIAHELAHVVQQSGAGASSAQPSLEVGSENAPEERAADAAADAVAGGGSASPSAGAAGVLRRKPGVDGKDSWFALTKNTEVRDADKDKGRVARAAEAVNRMLATTSGGTLANDLYKVFCPGDKCGTAIKVVVVGKIPGEDPAKPDVGLFDPDTAGAKNYTIWVKHVDPPAAGVMRGPSTGWPSNDCSKSVCPAYSDPESEMAGTLFHEALHIWFLNTQKGATHPTGHGPEPAKPGGVEKAFMDRLQSMNTDLANREKQIHQSQQPKTPPREKSLRDVDLP